MIYVNARNCFLTKKSLKLALIPSKYFTHVNI